jgi:hypothetical protein
MYVMGKVQIVRQKNACDNPVRNEKHMCLEPLNFNDYAL